MTLSRKIIVFKPSLQTTNKVFTQNLAILEVEKILIDFLYNDNFTELFVQKYFSYLCHLSFPVLLD